MKHQSFVYTQLNDQTVLFQIIQFNVSHLLAHSVNVKQSIWPIDRTLFSDTTLSQSGPESKGNEDVLHIPQSSRTEASSSDG